MDFNPELTHTNYSPFLLLAASVAYSIVIAGVGLVVSRVAHNTSPFFWIIFAVVASIPLLIFGGQHFDFVNQFTPTSYCFGEPGIVNGLALVLPAVAVMFAARRAG
jgi:hypothetical protein